METSGETNGAVQDGREGLLADGELWDEVPSELTLDEQYAEATAEELEQLTVKAFREGFNEYRRALKRLTESKPPRNPATNKHSTTDLIERVLPFVAWRVAEKHLLSDPEVSAMDRVQNSNLYVANAAQSYDPNHGASFITMFDSLLDEYILRPEKGGIYLKSSLPISQTGLVRVPNAKSPYYRVKKVHDGKNKLFGRQLEAEELLDLTEFKQKDIQAYQDHSIEYVPLHDIEDFERQSGMAFSEQFIDQDAAIHPHESVASKTADEGVKEALGVLTPQERAVLTAHLGLNGDEPLSINEIATELELSQRHARHKYSLALKKLREVLSIRELVEVETVKTESTEDEGQKVAEEAQAPRVELAEETYLTKCVRRLLGGKGGGVLAALERRGIPRETVFENAQIHPLYAKDKLRGRIFMSEDEAKRLLDTVDYLVSHQLKLSLREVTALGRLVDTISMITEEADAQLEYAM